MDSTLPHGLHHQPKFTRYERIVLALERIGVKVGRIADQMALQPGEKVGTRHVAQLMGLKTATRVAQMAAEGKTLHRAGHWKR